VCVIGTPGDCVWGFGNGIGGIGGIGSGEAARAAIFGCGGEE
jgi:hypothetical protein